MSIKKFANFTLLLLLPSPPPQGCVDTEGIGVEMERLAAKMGGTLKWPYNDSECLDADFFKVVADHLVKESGVR